MKPFILLLTLLLVGCSTSLVPSGGQPVTYIQGRPVLTHKGRTTEVVLDLLSPEADDYYHFNLAVLNTGKYPFNIGPENVTASSNGHPVKVQTYEALAKSIKRTAMVNAIVAGAAAGAQAGLATQPAYANTTGRVGVYNPYGQNVANANYSAQTTYYNPAQTALAQSQIQANAAQTGRDIRVNRDASLAGIQGMLRMTTVYPGRMEMGMIALNDNVTENLTITVNAAGELHTFHFNTAK
jgi:hypothetical protein